MSDEADQELIGRYQRVSGLLDQAKQKRDRIKPGGTRDRASRWCGSLYFAILQIKSEIDERSLTIEELRS